MHINHSLPKNGKYFYMNYEVINNKDFLPSKSEQVLYSYSNLIQSIKISNPDIVVMLGDNIDNAYPVFSNDGYTFNYYNNINYLFLNQLISDIDLPVIMVIGNHEYVAGNSQNDNILIFKDSLYLYNYYYGSRYSVKLTNDYLAGFKNPYQLGFDYETVDIPGFNNIVNYGDWNFFAIDDSKEHLISPDEVDFVNPKNKVFFGEEIANKSIFLSHIFYPTGSFRSNFSNISEIYWDNVTNEEVLWDLTNYSADLHFCGHLHVAQQNLFLFDDFNRQNNRKNTAVLNVSAFIESGKKKNRGYFIRIIEIINYDQPKLNDGFQCILSEDVDSLDYPLDINGEFKVSYNNNLIEPSIYYLTEDKSSSTENHKRHRTNENIVVYSIKNQAVINRYPFVALDSPSLYPDPSINTIYYPETPKKLFFYSNGLVLNNCAIIHSIPKNYVITGLEFNSNNYDISNVLGRRTLDEENDEVLILLDELLNDANEDYKFFNVLKIYQSILD